MLLLLDATAHATTQDVVKAIIEKGLMFIISLFFVLGVAAYVFTLLYRRFVRIRNDHKARTAEQIVVEKIIEKPRCNVCRLDEAKTVDALAKHPLFSTIDYLMVTMVPRLPIKEVGRKTIFQDFLELKLRKIREHFQKWMISQMDELEEKDQELLKVEFQELVTAIVREYESDAMRIGIPDIAIHKFSEWHAERVKHLEREITLVMDSDWIVSNVERVGYLFTVVENIVRGTILDAENAVYQINGQLTGKTYRGVIIGPCPERK